MSERDNFLARTLARHVKAVEAAHNGDPSPFLDMWSTKDPVTLLGGRTGSQGDPTTALGLLPVLRRHPCRLRAGRLGPQRRFGLHGRLRTLLVLMASTGADRAERLARPRYATLPATSGSATSSTGVPSHLPESHAGDALGVATLPRDRRSVTLNALTRVANRPGTE